MIRYLILFSFLLFAVGIGWLKLTEFIVRRR